MLGVTILQVIGAHWVLWVITLCSILATGVTLERFRTMRKADVDTEGLLRRLAERLDRGDVPGAISICDATPGPVGDTLGTGLRRLQLLERVGKNPDEIEEGISKAMEEHGLHVINYLERNLTLLATMASLAPILGMLGTVLGMISVFLRTEQSGLTSEAVAGGIGEALYCTAGGLIVAAMSTVEFNYFTGRVNRFALQVQSAGTKLVDRLLHRQSLARTEGLANEASK